MLEYLGVVPHVNLTGVVDPLTGGHRFQTLGVPIVLDKGFQGSIVTYGYGAAEQNGNAANFSKGDGGAGLISFVGSSRFGAAGSYPATPDGGPAIRYGAGSFQFRGLHDLDLNPVAAVATHSQTGFPVTHAADGLGTTSGWAIGGGAGPDFTLSQAAVFPFAAGAATATASTISSGAYWRARWAANSAACPPCE